MPFGRQETVGLQGLRTPGGALHSVSCWDSSPGLHGASPRAPAGGAVTLGGTERESPEPRGWACARAHVRCVCVGLRVDSAFLSRVCSLLNRNFCGALNSTCPGSAHVSVTGLSAGHRRLGAVSELLQNESHRVRGQRSPGPRGKAVRGWGTGRVCRPGGPGPWRGRSWSQSALGGPGPPLPQLVGQPRASD